MNNVCLDVCMSVVRIWHVCEWLWCTLLILIIIPASFLLITMNDSNSNNKYTKLLTKRHEHYTEQNVSVTSMINPTSPHIPSSIRHSLHEAVSRPRPQKSPATTNNNSNWIEFNCTFINTTNTRENVNISYTQSNNKPTKITITNNKYNIKNKKKKSGT